MSTGILSAPLWRYLLGGVMLASAGLAQADAADAGLRISRSVELGASAGAADTESAKLDLLEHQGVVAIDEPLRVEGPRNESAAGSQDLSERRTAAQVPAFVVFDARSFLLDDFDRDGFFDRFSVSFDADVDHGSASVYARLYLSYAGGPWNLYHTTGVFEIVLDRDDDDYEVVTDLVGGYPTGHYDVMLELYLVGFSSPVAVYGPYQDPALRALPLESDSRDALPPPHYDDDYHGHAGGLGWSLGLLLAAWGWRRWTGP